jgi:hypothetical protein
MDCQRLVDCARQGRQIERDDVERTLERGFASLMALEAELQRTGGSESRTVNEPDATVVTIETLRAALVELRLVSSGSDHRMGYGFVLPARAYPRRRRAPRTSSRPDSAG